VQLDPRSSDAIYNLAETYQNLRQFDRAMRAFDKAVSISPDGPFARWERLHAMLSSGTGLEKVRQGLREDLQATDFRQMAQAAIGPSSTAGFAATPSFLLTADPAHQPSVERLTLPEFIDTVGYYTLKADMNRAQRKPALERAYLDSARAVLERQIREQPDESSFRAQVGLVYAQLGRKADAIREGETAVRLLPVSKEAYRGASLAIALASIYATVGERAAAVNRLEYLLSIPSLISKPGLRIDPRWAPLHGDPRFERLVAGR
jgi:tetratricopeptide (TPR) repeat protein